MASDTINDRLSIKNLLFTKALPNYVIPVPTAGYKTYPCIDCGDRFLFKSSFEYHINRQSVVITYMCRYCNQQKTFNNRCKLLSHIRSHAFKTATINVSDLKVDPLPASYFDNLAAKHGIRLETNNYKATLLQQIKAKTPSKFSCLECNLEITVKTHVNKDRAKHFMQYTNKVHACPVCLFALPTTCGLKSHLRLHSGNGPFICPECGVPLTKKMIQYPYTHDCEGFRMMRATARYKCPLPQCYLFHPNEYKSHMRNNHMKRVFKCPLCVVACFNEGTIAKHLKSHATEAKALIFFQCEMCPGRLVLNNQMDNHLRGHITNSAFVYPCWACGQVFREVRSLLQHYSNNHGQTGKFTPQSATAPVSAPKPDKPGLVYRVVKRCDKCTRSFTYKCKYEQISILPNECPFKCSASASSKQVITEPEFAIPAETTIKCYLCKKDIPENWDDIKIHFAADHKEHRCLDATLVIPKMNVKKLKRKQRREARKRFRETLKKLSGPTNSKNKKNAGQPSSVQASFSSNNPLACKKCGHEAQDKLQLEDHLKSHRDSNMAYQCMDCGQCFVVKPSFTTHLLVEHGISDVNEYILSKQCYNADALLKNNFTTDKVKEEEPLRENQCQICRDQFDDPEDLEKHFRVHGMAFLMKNSSAKNNSP
ncbi:zinc finger protein 532-like [Cydia fagiglandana]|uniref:zinc finger protein 532-like n=1 Tax=Cydia fagiglandana TaxID=1458189 RepID=UPI002FEE03AF